MKHTATALVAFVVFASTLSAQTSPADDALVAALKGGQCKAVEGLLKKGASPNARGEEGRTALMLAAIPCQAPILKLLLDKGADIEARDEQGWTALIFAIDRNPPEGQHRKFQLEVVQLLLARKASTAVKDNDGSTVIHHAAQQRNIDVLKLLLGMGLAVDARNKDGATPLFYAAAYDEPESALVLITAGASVNARDNSGTSVLSIATRRGNTRVAQILESRGALADAPAAQPGATAAGAPDLSAIDGITFEQWARANGRLTAGATLPSVIASLGLDTAGWERVHERWTERLAQHTLSLGTEYAKHFKAGMEEAVRAVDPGASATGEPIPFEKWVEVLEATHAAAERVPALYGMSTADWNRVNAWWNQRMKANEVNKAEYNRLSETFLQQFSAKPPSQSAPALREGALEANREPMPLEKWVEIQQAGAAAQELTLTRQGLTMGQWIRANLWWGEKFNQAMLRMDKASAAERAEAQKMHVERLRLSELYRKKYAQGVPW